MVGHHFRNGIAFMGNVDVRDAENCDLSQSAGSGTGSSRPLPHQSQFYECRTHSGFRQCRSVGMLLLLPLVLFTLTSLVIRREEKHLAEAFGQSYLDYKTRVRRWL